MHRSASKGFTIIELLIVMIVIAILATLTTVFYNNYLMQGHTAILKSDLTNGADVMSNYQQTYHNYPPSQSAVTLRPSSGDSFTYVTNSENTKYCLLVAGYGQSWYVTNTNPTPQNGTSCPSLVATVITLAGSGARGWVDGAAASAEFALPSGIGVDSQGDIWIADTFNQRIRELKDGVVSTVAGNGSMGWVEGTGTQAEFAYPSGDMKFDSFGNAYVADSNTGTIRKITPSGAVTSFVGDGIWYDYKEGTGTGAGFYWPKGLAIDSQNNVYVADTDNERIREVTPGATTSTYAGNGTAGFVNGPAANAEFNSPFGVAIDNKGNLYVADMGNNCVRKITPQGVVSTLAGSGTAGFVNGPSAQAEFNQPAGIAVDQFGYVYVADMGNNAIREIAPNGTVSTLAGNGTAGYADGPGSSAEFNRPYSIAINAQDDIYVADTYNNRIREILQ